MMFTEPRFNCRHLMSLFLLSAIFFSTSSLALSTHTLTSGNWSLISIPADPGSNTIEQLFGDDLPPANYGAEGSWLIFAYDTAANQYRSLSLGDTLAANTGYWIVQFEADSIVLDLPESLPALAGGAIAGCSADAQCTSRVLVGGEGDVQWNLVGASLDTPIGYGDTRFQSNNTACSTACSPIQAREANQIAEAYVYDDGYEALTDASALQPWSGVWIPVLANASPIQWVIPVSDASPGTGVVDYDIVYVRQPRYGDNTLTVWPEVTRPGSAEPGADLMLLHPDGSEEVLVEGGNGAVTDPFISFDAQWVYYSYFHDVRPESLNGQRSNLSYRGSDIFRINVVSREVQQITFGEFTPNTAAGNWDESNPLDPGREFNRLGYGVLNLGPTPLPGGRIMFTSNRNAFVPARGLTTPTLQLFVMDENGDNVTQVGHFNLGSALHPTVLRDGRVIFSTLESQGARVELVWGLWSMNPDGSKWKPVVSAFTAHQAFHFVTQLANDDIVFTDYYNQNNNGFGALYRLPLAADGEVAFNGATPEENTDVVHTRMSGGSPFTSPITISFSPIGMYSITPFTTGSDSSAPIGADGGRVGKFTHPSAAPNGDLLAVWTPGPANHQNGLKLPAYDGGLYVIPNSDIVNAPGDLQLIKNDPAYNEAWPRALVPYSAVHGIEQPATLPFLPNDGSQHALLPAGSPHALVGASSLIKRETAPGNVSHSGTFDGLDPFNTAENRASSNWEWQGADAGKYTDDDIWAVRIVAMEPNTQRSYGPQDIFDKQFKSFANERLRILGEIPVRKFNADQSPILDPEGNPDTSFLVKIPADTPFTFQTIDRNAMVLNMAQTWHQMRPGEVRTDCGGCHAHSQAPLEFSQTAASQPSYEIYDLNQVTPMLNKSAEGIPTLDIVNSPLVDVEFHQDIRPLLTENCVACHTDSAASPPGNLVLDDHALYTPVVNSGFDLPGDYARLAADADARWGYPPIIPNGIWRQTNASRYVRKFQSRRSLLSWKIFGERLDGWSNTDHPTETVPGDPLTFPGDNLNQGDLDFTGSIMPPASTQRSLSYAQKMTVARWIDLGAPIELDSTYGWFFDDLRPTLTISSPHADAAGPLSFIRFGVSDANSGIATGSISVTADIPIFDRPPNSELIDLFSGSSEGIYTLNLGAPFVSSEPANLYIEVADNQGNVTRLTRTFTTGGEL